MMETLDDLDPRECHRKPGIKTLEENKKIMTDDVNEENSGPSGSTRMLQKVRHKRNSEEEQQEFQGHSREFHVIGKKISGEHAQELLSKLKKERSLDLIRFSSSWTSEKSWQKIQDALKGEEKFEVKTFELLDTDVHLESCPLFVETMDQLHVTKISLRRSDITPKWLSNFAEELTGAIKWKLRVVKLPDNDHLKNQPIGDSLNILLTRCSVRRVSLDSFQIEKDKQNRIHLRPSAKRGDWTWIANIAVTCRVYQVDFGGNNKRSHLSEFSNALEGISEKIPYKLPRLKITTTTPVDFISPTLQILRFISEKIIFERCLGYDGFYFQLRKIMQIHSSKSSVVANGDSIVLDIDESEVNQQREKLLLGNTLRGKAEHELQETNSCKILDFSYSTMKFPEDSRTIVIAMKRYDSLESIIFQRCNLKGSDVEEITNAVISSNGKVCMLDFSYNPSIGESGAKAIANLLKTTQIENIKVFGCNIEGWHDDVMIPALAARKQLAGCTISYNSDFVSVNVEPVGGLVKFERSGCSISFPPNSVKNPTQMSFRIKPPSATFPPATIPVTPIIECLPSGSTFTDPVSVKLPTWIVPNTPVTLKILTRESKDHEWKDDSQITHRDGDFVHFDLLHFCEEVACVEEGEAVPCRYKYMVFTKQQGASFGKEQKIISVFVPDDFCSIQNVVQEYNTIGYEQNPVDQSLVINNESRISLAFTPSEESSINISPENRRVDGECIIRSRVKKIGFTVFHGEVGDQTSEKSFVVKHVMTCNDSPDFEEDVVIRWHAQRSADRMSVTINNFYAPGAMFQKNESNTNINAPVGTVIGSAQNVQINPGSGPVEEESDERGDSEEEHSELVTENIQEPNEGSSSGDSIPLSTSQEPSSSIKGSDEESLSSSLDAATKKVKDTNGIRMPETAILTKAKVVVKREESNPRKRSFEDSDNEGHKLRRKRAAKRETGNQIPCTSTEAD